MEWYCPATGRIVPLTRRKFFSHRSEEGLRVIPLQEPGLSSDIAFLWGAYLGLMVVAAPVYAAGFLIIRGHNPVLATLGYALLVLGLTVPMYWGVSMIVLGKTCTRRTDAATTEPVPPLSYRIGWVMAAKGAGIVVGAAMVIAVALFLMISGTASYIY